MGDFVSQYNSQINDFLNPLVGPQTPGAGLLKAALILYGAMAAPHLPDPILKWFDWVPFKIFVLFLIVWTANQEPSLAIAMAVAFYASMNVLSGKKAFDKFTDVHHY